MTTRIHTSEKHSSHLSLWIGLLGVLILLGGAYFYFTHKYAAETIPGEPSYLRAVSSDSKLRAILSDAQYHVTRENGTETAFQNQYWNNFTPGLYVDVITGEPLFSSADKFEGNTGRPCFTKPIAPDKIVEKHDTSFNMDRTELRAARSDSHLGHLFKDGPPPTNLRYAINSAALRFVPLEKMEKQGYGGFIRYVTPGSATPTPPAAAPPSAASPAPK